MILANAGAPSPAELNGFLLSAAFVAGLFLLGLKIADHFKKKDGLPQPLRTVKEKEYAEADHVDKSINEVKTSVARLGDEMREGHKELTRQADMRFATLSGKISEIGINNANALGELRGELKRIKTP